MRLCNDKPIILIIAIVTIKSIGPEFPVRIELNKHSHTSICATSYTVIVVYNQQPHQLIWSLNFKPFKFCHFDWHLQQCMHTYPGDASSTPSSLLCLGIANIFTLKMI